VQRAALKSSQRQTGYVVWLTLANGTRCKANLNDLVCVIQSADNPRNKLLYLAGEAHPAEINATWKEASDMLQQAGIDHFAVNKRYALVSRKFIHSYRPPFVHTNGCPLKIEVVSEQAKAFEQWLHMQ
jgi:hypothetical protein